MPLIAIVFILAISWTFETGPLADISGWWVAGAAAAAFIWFEFFEPMLGLDRKSRADDSLEKAQQERAKKRFARK